MAGLTTRDPTEPAFWDERFVQGVTPWDRAGVPDALRDFVARQRAPLTTLIPGCGAAYELVFLSEAGWSADAIDFAPAAVATARAAAGPWAARVHEADFFRYAPAQPVELIYERAFLCAMPRSLWPQVAARWAELLAPGALLAGFFFTDARVQGPPFGLAEGQLEALLAPYFTRIDDQPVADSIPVFVGKERWMVWQRR